MRSLLPVITILAALVALWYLGAVYLNAPWAYDQAERAGVDLTTGELIADTMSQERPVLPAPHQVAREIWETTAEKRITSKRSLVYHGWITLSATLVPLIIFNVVGFAVGGDPWSGQMFSITMVSGVMWSMTLGDAMIVLAIVILLFGTKKLRNVGGDLGGAIRNFKKSVKDEEGTQDKAEPEGQVIEGKVTEEKDKV